MGISKHSYLNTYIKLYGTAEKKRNLVIKGCKDHPEITQYENNFCGKCGKNLVEIINGTTIDKLNGIQYLQDRGFNHLGRLYQPEYSDFIISNINSSYNLNNQGVDLYTSHDINILDKEETIKKEIEWFKEEFSKEIEILKEGFGEGNIKICWGLVIYYA